MSTYSENLHITIVDSLQSQYLNQQSLNAQMTATGFTLYYAQGATGTAEEKLEEAKTNAAFKETVNKQSVITGALANNLLTSATEANQYLTQSISNTAVCASNVQVAANAVIRLAGDMGSIMSIVTAADAENLLSQEKTQILVNVPGPHVSSPAHSKFIRRQVDFFNMPGTNKILQDTDGDDVAHGRRYVVFVFTVLTEAYKKGINNFDNFLSASCEPFMLTIKLKGVDSSTVAVESSGNLQKLEFTVDGNTANAIEYRCIFLPVGVPDLFFNVTIAEQVSAGNYSIAKKQGRKNLYEVGIGSETTDNFGSPLVPGKAYRPVILTFYAGDDLLKFTNTLSVIDEKAAFYYNEK